MATARQSKRTKRTQEYNQAIIELLPEQGYWNEDGYRWLTDHTRRLVEFTNGRIEMLPPPTDQHQSISANLYMRFIPFIESIGGKVLVAALRLRLQTDKFRTPDLLVLLSADDPRRQNKYWHGADLVLEVVSPDNPERDIVDKPRDYAQARIPEYWIVNPQTETITVLKLERAKYAEHGVFARGTQATSALLPEFAVSVDEVFDAR